MKNILPNNHDLKRCVLRDASYGVAFGLGLRDYHFKTLEIKFVAAGIPAGPRTPQPVSPHRFIKSFP